MPKLIQPRPFHARKTIFVALVILALIAYSYVMAPDRARHERWQGATMGTTYRVTIADSPFSPEAVNALKEEIENYLDELNRQMSTYMPESEISRFNRTPSTDRFRVSLAFAAVVKEALKLSTLTGGAFDPTVLPLSELWGFGNATASEHFPTPAEIAEARQNVDYWLVRVPSPTELQKRRPGVRLSLDAIAKGYAADEVARLIREKGAPNVFVEVGGDGIAYGESPQGAPWRIGIDVPRFGSTPGEAIQAVVPLSDQGIATSGDYRNFRSDPSGNRLGHLLDPRTGTPVENDVGSVTVVAESCALADGLATALYVLGPERGLALVEENPGVEAYFVLRDADGGFRERASPGFVTLPLTPAAH